MDYYSKQINQLVEALSLLPGIGSKTAQRLAFHILNMPKQDVYAVGGSLLFYCGIGYAGHGRRVTSFPRAVRLRCAA